MLSRATPPLPGFCTRWHNFDTPVQAMTFTLTYNAIGASIGIPEASHATAMSTPLQSRASTGASCKQTEDWLRVRTLDVQSAALVD